MRSRSRKRATTTKKKNPNNGLKKRVAVLVISSSSEEPNEEEENEEEEVKSSNSSNQNMNEESMEEEEEEKEVVEEEAENVKRKGKKIIPSGNATCRFPANSIKRIIKNEGIVFRSTQEAIFLINKATEKFLEKFCENAYSNVVKDRKKAVHYKHISSIVSKRKRYDFLSDCVPEKVKAGDALSESKSAET